MRSLKKKKKRFNSRFDNSMCIHLYINISRDDEWSIWANMNRAAASKCMNKINIICSKSLYNICLFPRQILTKLLLNIFLLSDPLSTRFHTYIGNTVQPTQLLCSYNDIIHSSVYILTLNRVLRTIDVESLFCYK